MGRIIEEMHETAKSLHASGVIDKRRMRGYEALYRADHIPRCHDFSDISLQKRILTIIILNI